MGVRNMPHSHSQFIYRRFFSLLGIFVLGVLSILGSGGGGSSSTPTDPLASLPYTGLRSAAVINSTDVEDFMLLAYFGNPSLYDVVQSPTVPSQTFSQVSTIGVQVSYSEPGLCGGFIQYDLDVNDSTGDFEGSVLYDGYDDCETSMSGIIQVSGQLNLQSGQFNHITMLFELLELTEMSSEAFVLSGRLEVSENGSIETINIDLRVRDEETGKVYWLDGYQIKVLHGFDSRSFEEVTIIAGRFYDPDRGYIDVYTEEPVRTYVEEAWPSSGIYIAEGAMNASSRLMFLSTVLYQVEADVDSDGIYEYDTGRVHYPGANTLPVAEQARTPLVTWVAPQCSMDRIV